MVSTSKSFDDPGRGGELEVMAVTDEIVADLVSTTSSLPVSVVIVEPVAGGVSGVSVRPPISIVVVLLDSAGSSLFARGASLPVEQSVSAVFAEISMGWGSGESIDAERVAVDPPSAVPALGMVERG